MPVLQPLDWTLDPLGDDDARAIVSWRYPAPYDCYDLPDDDPGVLAELLGGSYCAVRDEAGRLAGFFCFGEAARVPPLAPLGAYDERAAGTDGRSPAAGGTVDLGLGLHPDRTGCGLGQAFVALGMRHARAVYGPVDLRLTVAAFNLRAIRAYERAGFEPGRAYVLPGIAARPGVPPLPRTFIVMHNHAGGPG